ncbi:MAG: Precorrin-8X methylmutase [Myxococcaceae bacterium]|nr:Precorrin-8X methylmutase [Myxococcaceae bacterium]
MDQHANNAGATSKRRGYCPGVWTPMSSGDGLIVRVRTSIRPITAIELRALAALASRHGNGSIELTRRANLQLRGVQPGALATLQSELVRLGLADASVEREKQLAPLLLSPLAELGQNAGPLATLTKSLEAMLIGPDSPLDLPSKFSLLVDRAPTALTEMVADLRLVLRTDGRVDLSVASEAGASFLGACQLEHAARATLCLLQALSEAQRQGSVRMRALVRARGSAALQALLAPWLIDGLPAERSAQTPSWTGFHAEPPSWFGLALPFGAGTAETWSTIASLAEQFGRGRLRVTPRRSVMVLGVAVQDQTALCEAALQHGLIVEPDDPALRLSACAGAPACASALGETRALASSLLTSLRPLLQGSFRVHVSGCDKSCAESGAADVTLLHAAGGVQLGLGLDVAETARAPVISLETAQQRLTALARDVRVRPPMTRHYDYEHDGAAIYRRSFSIIRSEARLTRFSPIEERVAVRLIHTSGMVDLAEDVHFFGGFAEQARAAIRAGAPILCDANMIVSGVTRSRLSAHNEVLCFLGDPRVPELAREQGTTRSAAALSLWGDRMKGAVVAIGNAPTALFRLLELFDQSDVRPAAVIGLPVGFVGAAESKEALALDGRVPAMIVRGRRGGSAMTVAAINALASDQE